MDLRFLCVILLCFLSFFSTHSSFARTGLALIHGTRDHREDAEGGYWKAEFIEQLTNNLPEDTPLYVVHCDFNQYMWHQDAAGCVAKQVIQFKNQSELNQVVLMTHSEGGNVARFILSNPTLHPDFMEVTKLTHHVIAIAPSSGGTVLADEVMAGGVFEAGLGWLLGYITDSVRQQRIGDMTIYNNEILLGAANRADLPVPFKTIVGTDVTASPINSDSYCNGYWLNAALKVTKIYLDKCSDGFLNCTSQSAAGEVLFIDKDRTDSQQNLSHNQSRHNCFGLEKLLASAFSMEF